MKKMQSLTMTLVVLAAALAPAQEKSSDVKCVPAGDGCNQMCCDASGGCTVTAMYCLKSDDAPAGVVPVSQEPKASQHHWKRIALLSAGAVAAGTVTYFATRGGNRPSTAIGPSYPGSPQK